MKSIFNDVLLVILLIFVKMMVIVIATLPLFAFNISMWWAFATIPAVLFSTNMVAGYFTFLTCPKCGNRNRAISYQTVFVDRGPCMEACIDHKCMKCGNDF